MNFPSFEIPLSKYRQGDFIINDEMIERYERKVEKQKNLRLLEFSLNKFFLTLPSFSSLSSYQRFIQLIQAGKNLFAEKTLYQKTIDLFRNRIGLPCIAFDREVHFRDKEQKINYLCSRELLENYFLSMIKCESQNSNFLTLDLPLTQEAVEIFDAYVYTNNIKECSLNVFKELYQFARTLGDKKFQRDLFNHHMKFFKEDNEELIDLECVKDFASDFIKAYFENRGIFYKFLPNNKFQITLDDFNFIFKKTSELNVLIIEQIDSLKIAFVPNTLMSCYINKNYLKKIVSIFFDYKPSFYSLNELFQIFINFYLPYSFLTKMELFDLSFAEILSDPTNKDKIEDYLLAVIAAAPSFDFVYAWLYEFNFEIKLFEKAEDYILKAIYLNPHKYKYVLYLVHLLRDQGKLTEAEIHLKNFAQIYPSEEIYSEFI